MRAVAVVLAAGSARRMGADKLALPFGGSTVLGCAVDAVRAAVHEVVLVVQPGAAGLPGVRLVPNPNHPYGMSTSVRAGVAAAPQAEAWLLVLGDMPGISPATIQAVLRALVSSGRGIVVPVYRGQWGHPVAFSARYREALLGLEGDVGARSLLRAHPHDVALVEVDDPGVVFDVDTLSDLVDPPPRAATAAASTRPRVLIKGAGEHATGSAHRLFRCGYPVAMTELAEPRAVRRRVAFSTAIYEGEICVEGVRAQAAPLAQAAEVLAGLDGSYIPVFVDPDCSLRQLWQPEVIIDGRILKHNLDNAASHAELVIGLGPGLVAGRDVDVVVETNRGHDLGRIICEGLAAANTGVPGEIGGRSAERVLRAPAAGVFEARVEIGDRVQAGAWLASVGGRPLHAAIDGVVRGLIQPGVRLRQGEKVGDIDPRGVVGSCTTLSDKTRTLSGAVLEIVASRFRGD